MDAHSKVVVKQVHSDILSKILELEPCYSRLGLIIKNSTMEPEVKKLLQHELKELLQHHTELGEMTYNGAIQIISSEGKDG